MKNKKYKKRSKDIFLKVKIVCPKHGEQSVYELEDEDGKIKAVGCVRCFGRLPIFDYYKL